MIAIIEEYTIMSVIFWEQLYIIDVVKPSMFIFTTQLERKVVRFDT